MSYSSRMSFLSSQHSRISLTPDAYLACAESVVPLVWGVIPWWGMLRHGWSLGGG